MPYKITLGIWGGPYTIVHTWPDVWRMICDMPVDKTEDNFRIIIEKVKDELNKPQKNND